MSYRQSQDNTPELWTRGNIVLLVREELSEWDRGKQTIASSLKAANSAVVIAIVAVVGMIGNTVILLTHLKG